MQGTGSGLLNKEEPIKDQEIAITTDEHTMDPEDENEVIPADECAMDLKTPTPTDEHEDQEDEDEVVPADECTVDPATVIQTDEHNEDPEDEVVPADECTVDPTIVIQTDEHNEDPEDEVVPADECTMDPTTDIQTDEHNEDPEDEVVPADECTMDPTTDIQTDEHNEDPEDEVVPADECTMDPTTDIQTDEHNEDPEDKVIPADEHPAPMWPMSPLEKLIDDLSMAENLETSTLKVIIRSDNQRGVYTKKRFRKGEFVCEYSGDIITMEEADKREEEYRGNKEGCFILHISRDVAIDGTRQFRRIGRLVNHAAKNTNLKLHNPVTINGVKRVALVASRDIREDEELFYDYGIR